MCKVTEFVLRFRLESMFRFVLIIKFASMSKIAGF